MKEILLGQQAKEFLKTLENKNYINNEESIIGEIFLEEIRATKPIYVAYDCSGGETFVEDFDIIMEAAKYASGIIAKTTNGELI